MSIHEHFSEFAGLSVVDVTPEGVFQQGRGLETPPEAASVAWRVSTAFENTSFKDVFARFLAEVDTPRVTALVIGYWGASYDDNTCDVVAALTEAAGSLPALRSLFVGDIVMEESEISWIEHSDISALFTAFPKLEQFGLRGGSGLVLHPITSPALRELRLEAGGLPAVVVRAVAASDLPNLEHLELWLGSEEYGGDTTVADLAPILSGERLPALRHLGLQNGEIQDEVAAAVAGAPIVARLDSLDLSMGTLTDEGAEALLSGQPLTHLRKLDLHHHFLTEEMIERIRAALAGVDVDLSERQEDEDDDWRYVAVAE